MAFFNYKLFIFFFLFTCIGSATAQQEYLFSHLGTHDGLGSNDVVAVQQDKKGFIWIGTFNGLQRYDGSRLLTFRHKADDTTSIPVNSVMAMQMDRKERLWLLCDNYKVGYFDINHFKYYPVQIRANPEAINKAEKRLFMDEEGNIYLRLFGEPLLRYNEATNEFSAERTPFSLPANWHVTWLYQDRQQYNYWIACDSGLAKYNPQTKSLSYRNHNTDKDPVIAHYASLTFTTIPYLDSKGRFWIISWPPNDLTIHSFNIHTKREERWETSLVKQLHYVYYELDGIKELSDSTLWFTGDNIFATFNNKENSFDIIQNNMPGEYSIHYDMIYSLYEDREKNIWVCTNKGLYRFNPSAQLFHTIGLKRAGKDSLYTPDVTDILQTQSGNILVSTWGSGIFVYDSNFIPKHLSYTETSFIMQNWFTWCMHQRANGDIWCGHQGGTLFILHPATNKVEKLQAPVFENSTIRQVAEDKEGNLWFGTQNGMLIKWIASTNTFIQVQRQLSSVFRLYIDWQGDVWVCTKTNGVYRIKATDGSIAYHYSTSSPARSRLMNITANDIIQYNDSLYVIASGGLNILNANTNAIRYLSMHNEAISNFVTNIVKDKQGLLWLSTQSGLFSINLQNESATSGYTESDGLQSINYNIGTSTMLKDGRILLGTVHNFVVFDPSELAAGDVTPPKVEITGFALMNKWLSMDSLAAQKTIVLPHDQNSVTIAFSTLAYQDTYAILYRLVGLDKEWISAKNNEAIYSYLPPGTYTFEIKAVNADDVFSKLTTLSITVQSPFWRTWWFYSLVLLAGITFLYLLDKERMKRKAILQSMRSNISGNLHEEINNALQNINVLSEIARIKADEEPKQSKNYIDEIHHKSNSLIEAMDDMLWSIDPANDTMAHTISRMKEIAHTISHRHNASIQVHNDTKVILLKPDMRRRHELMVIYKTALQLLAGQMRAPTIQVELSYIKNHVQLNIFAANVKLANNSQVHDTIKNLKAKASSVMTSLEVQADEKGVGIILSVRR